jgi:hypothetical protein
MLSSCFIIEIVFGIVVDVTTILSFFEEVVFVIAVGCFVVVVGGVFFDIL